MYACASALLTLSFGTETLTSTRTGDTRDTVTCMDSASLAAVRWAGHSIEHDVRVKNHQRRGVTHASSSGSQSVRRAHTRPRQELDEGALAFGAVRRRFSARRLGATDLGFDRSEQCIEIEGFAQPGVHAYGFAA